MEKKGDLGTKRRPKGDPSPQFGLPLILYSLNSLNFSALLLVQCTGNMLIGGKMFLFWQPANLHGYIFPTLHPGPEMCKWVSNTHWVYERQKMQVVPNEPVISLGYLIIWIASHRKYLTQVCLKLMWWGWWKYIPKHFAFAILPLDLLHFGGSFNREDPWWWRIHCTRALLSRRDWPIMERLSIPQCFFSWGAYCVQEKATTN